jgi:uncharacterized membrane protein
VKIEWDGRPWDFDESEITVKQGIVIHLAHGITVAEFSQGLVTMDARALQAGYWLMLQQNGVIKPIADCDFKAVPFAEAYATARLAEMRAEEEEQKAREAAEQAARDAGLDAGDRAGAMGPTSPLPAGPPSLTSAIPTATTPQPVQRYLPPPPG